MPATARMLLASLAAALLAGCSAVPTPRGRLGSLPYPGLFTFYVALDPDALGRHRYESFPPPWSEKGLGLIYCRRAGFIDVSHVRWTIDWTRYLALRARDAMRRGRKALTLDGPDRGTLRLTFDPPPGLDAATLDALAITIGQRSTYDLGLWHEVISWYGYRSSGVWPEDRSAFTWDDLTAHLVGMDVVGRALAAEFAAGEAADASTFDRDVTADLDREMADLGAVPPAETTAAARRVEGEWWTGSDPLKRFFDTGFDGSPVRPWLVTGVPTFPEQTPWAYALPTLADVNGRDLSGSFGMEMEPHIFEADRVRADLPDRPRWIRFDRDLPVLITTVRRRMREKYGPGFDTPEPGGYVAAPPSAAGSAGGASKESPAYTSASGRSMSIDSSRATASKP